MKNIRILSVLLCLLMLLPLAACGGGGQTDVTTPEETTAEELPPESLALDVILSGASAFTVVRPEEASNMLINSAKQVVTNFKTYTGVDLKFRTDFIYPTKDTEESLRYEILVGMCDRDECREVAATLRSKDYFAGVVGTKIVLLGLDDEMTQRAVDNFISKILSKKMKNNPEKNFSMSADENLIFRFSSYTLNTCTILGEKLENYSVTYLKTAPYSAERTARVFAREIANGSGYILTISSHSTVPGEGREIVFGAADSAANALTDRHSFSVKAEGTKLFVCAECELGYAAALNYLTKELFHGDNVTVPEGFSYTGTYTDFQGGMQYIDNRLGAYRVIFNNIYGNCDTSLYPAPTRNQMQAELHIEYNPDFVGLQECSPNSRGSSSYITAMVKAGYAEVPCTSGAPSGTNYTPLLYKKDKFDVIDSGYELYNDGANDKSKSLTWGVFRDKATGKVFSVISTHFYWTSDDLGHAARLKDAAQITSRAKAISDKYGSAVVIGGDLNCTITSAPIMNMFNSGFVDIQNIAGVTENLTTHHSYPTYNTQYKLYEKMVMPTSAYTAAIDHAFVWNGASFTARLFEVVTDDYTLLSSDHCPVLVDFDIQ